MPRVYVSIGSNVDRDFRIRESVTALRNIFGELELSPVYNSAAVGFDGSDFLNLVVAFDSDLPVETVAEHFRRIEDDLGRDRNLPKFASRPIDLDILLYDDLVLEVPGIRVPRSEISEHAFVLKPLQDIAPDLRHPQTGQSYAEMWRLMEPNAPRLDLYPLRLADT